MEIFNQFISWVAELPDVLSLLLSPVLFCISAIVFAIMRKIRLLSFFALLFGAIGAFLVGCKGGSDSAFLWGLLYAALWAVVAMLVRIPRRERKKLSREDALYEKFYMPIEEERSDLPPKVNCFEEEGESVNESGVCLAHVTALLKKLQEAKLSATDRLEADVIARTLREYRYKRLNGEEMRTLNDCLATVLRLTAKYSL